MIMSPIFSVCLSFLHLDLISASVIELLSSIISGARDILSVLSIILIQSLSFTSPVRIACASTRESTERTLLTSDSFDISSENIATGTFSFTAT